MVNHRSEMKPQEIEKMRGGDGKVRITHLLDAGSQKNVRMLAEAVLEPGCSIGEHKHDDETEYYLIISGNGTVNDNGKDVAVKAGDAMITGGGASHSIKNTGSVPLVLHALVVTH